MSPAKVDQMLPDLPILKRTIGVVLRRHVQLQVAQQVPFYKDIRKRIWHEGNRSRIIRADGSISEGMPTRAEASEAIKFKDIPDITMDATIGLLESMAGQLSQQIVGQLIAEIESAVEATGNTVKSEGREANVDAFFEMLEKIEIDFDESGTPHMPSILAPPSQLEKIKNVFEKIEGDRQLRETFDDIIERKRFESTCREANRKLVG